MFTFILLEEDQTGSAAGKYTLAVFKQPKSYTCLKLADMIKEVKELKKNQYMLMKLQLRSPTTWEKNRNFSQW